MRPIAFLLLMFSLMFQGIEHANEASSPISFIEDASGSMWGQMQGKIEMVIASEVLSTSVDKLPENCKISLEALGYQCKNNCRAVEFLVNVINRTKSELNTAVQRIRPLGMTPLAYLATQVLNHPSGSKIKATKNFSN